jgi:hypothetical protein
MSETASTSSTSTSTATSTGVALVAVDRYIEFWNAATADEQRRLSAETFAAGVSYHAPLGLMQGVEELVGFRTQFAQHTPGYRFQPRSWPDAHHDRARLQWELVVGEESFAAGTDVLELDDDGHIISVASFLDRAPEGFDPHAHH